MASDSLLKRISDERADLAQGALAHAAAITLGRRRVLSGIRWRANLIVTAAEAIEGAEQVDVRFGPDGIAAEVIAVDLTTDVAVVRTVAGDARPADPPPPPEGPRRAEPVRLGESVALVGRTVRGPAVAWGTVRIAGPAWSSLRGGRIEQRIELSAGFGPELEGAAIINMAGEIVGMAVPGVNQRVLGIPTATIESVVIEIERHGHLPKPYLGIRLQPLWLDDSTRAKLSRGSRRIAAVAGVDPGSPAEAAHMELGDLVLTLDGEAAEGVSGLARRIAGTRPGQIIALEVLRGGKPLTLNVQIGERPRH